MQPCVSCSCTRQQHALATVCMHAASSTQACNAHSAVRLFDFCSGAAPVNDFRHVIRLAQGLFDRGCIICCQPFPQLPHYRAKLWRWGASRFQHHAAHALGETVRILRPWSGLQKKHATHIQ